MKRLLIVSALLLVTVLFSNAQGFRLGAKAGANLQQINGVGFSNGFEFGYQAGGFIELDFSKTFGIQPEVVFSETVNRLGSNSGQILNVSTTDNINLSYLSIPILLRISTGKLITFLVGPQYSILLNNGATLLVNSQNAFKTGDFGMVGGLQFNLGILRVYGRYYAGMSDISQATNSSSWKSQQLQVGVGLKLFSIQKKEKPRNTQ